MTPITAECWHWQVDMSPGSLMASVRDRIKVSSCVVATYAQLVKTGRSPSNVRHGIVKVQRSPLKQHVANVSSRGPIKVSGIGMVATYCRNVGLADALAMGDAEFLQLRRRLYSEAGCMADDVSHLAEGPLFKGSSTSGIDAVIGGDGSYSGAHVDDPVSPENHLTVLEGTKEVLQWEDTPAMRKSAYNTLNADSISDMAKKLADKGIPHWTSVLNAGDGVVVKAGHAHAAFNHGFTISLNCTVIRLEEIGPILEDAVKKYGRSSTDTAALGKGWCELVESYTTHVGYVVMKRAARLDALDCDNRQYPRALSDVQDAVTTLARWQVVLKALRTGFIYGCNAKFVSKMRAACNSVFVNM
jgi:JmjC domain, hydroxylase